MELKNPGRLPEPRSTENARICQDEKFRRLVEIIEDLGKVIVAYSGGVDSAFLLKVAHDVLGDDALGVLAISESLDRNESRAALEVAEKIGVSIQTIETHEYQRDEYRRNDAFRCYHCKTELFVTLTELARNTGYPHVVDGSNLDDQGDYRPGMQARTEQGVRSPLQEAGLTKEEIRMYSRALGLPTWDKPAAPCLSSRIPYGTEVTHDKLRQVEAAEAALREFGFRVSRVRHHGEVARIEIPDEEFPALLEQTVREEMTRRIKDIGFTFVALDIQGFRSGGLNEALARPEASMARQPLASRLIPPSDIQNLS